MLDRMGLAASNARARRPDFFIVGAPKCGTTAMATYLSEHPDIGMCPREVHYFGSDLPQLARLPGRHLTSEQYLALFEPVKDKRRVGEHSVWYLYSTCAAQEIKEFSPDADIIIMLRNPVDAVYSLHSQFLRNSRETVREFDRALALDDAREAGRVARSFVPVSYRAAMRFSEQVERYLSVFGREKVHIVLFDDLVERPLESFRAVCCFLGVDSEFTPDVRVINPNRVLRSRAVGRLVNHPPSMKGDQVSHHHSTARLIVRAVLPWSARDRLIRTIKRLNRKHEPRPEMPKAVRVRLQAEFADEIAALNNLLGIDLARH